MRRPIVAGNWKMNKTMREATDLVVRLRKELDGFDPAEIAICPPFTALGPVAQALSGSSLQLGAQNVHWDSPGAYTGEIAASMLRELGCRYVIVGHSERRSLFYENDTAVQKKTRAVLAAGMHPIVCVGETLTQREAGQTERVVRGQIENGLQGLSEKLSDVVIAYEPVWAIGTGQTATADQVQSVHEFIRTLLTALSDPATAASVRIQYGGSVKPENAAELFALPDVDGGLIGGASLTAESFGAVVRAVG